MLNIFRQREELRRENQTLRNERDLLLSENGDLNRSVDDLWDENDKLKSRISIVEKWENDIPNDTEKREAYLSNITIHYKNVMKDQLARMIEEQRDALSKIDLPDYYTQIYRSNINCLLLIKGFYERCQTEYLGMLQEKRSDYQDNY